MMYAEGECLPDYELRPCFIAYMDVLGSKSVFEDSDEKIKKYTRSLDDAYLQLQSYTHDLEFKAFSDNILLMTYSCNSESLNSILYAVAYMQLNCILNHGILFRGGISNKTMYSNNTFSIGRGLIEAHEIESKIARCPRVVLSDDLPHDDHTLLLNDANDNHTFVNYLTLLVEDEFSVDQKVIDHRDSIVALMDQNATLDDCVKSKHSWLIRYHNSFCDLYNLPYKINEF